MRKSSKMLLLHSAEWSLQGFSREIEKPRNSNLRVKGLYGGQGGELTADTSKIQYFYMNRNL